MRPTCQQVSSCCPPCLHGLHLRQLALYLTCASAAAVQNSPPQISMAAARAEAEEVMFQSVSAALAKANLKPGQVRTLLQPSLYAVLWSRHLTLHTVLEA